MKYLFLILTIVLSSPAFATAKVASLLGFSSSIALLKAKDIIVKASEPNTCTPLEIELKTDPWGDETEWQLVSATGQIIDSAGDVNKGPEALERNKLYKKIYCINSGHYIFSIKDDFGDGLADCDRYSCGYYKISLDGEQIVHGEGNDFAFEVSHDIVVSNSNTPIITARGEYAAKGEGKEEAFDGNIDTKWLDFSATSWIQYQFPGEQK